MISPDPILARRGDLVVCLASTQEEIEAAQRLRYGIFYDELGASPSPENQALKRDCDYFDAFCDHLLVIAPYEKETFHDTDIPVFVPRGRLLATCRLTSQDHAQKAGRFYTQEEFSILELMARKPHLRYLELGRSCVLASYRTTFVVDLLWRGIWKYARRNGIDVMFGCASLYGTNPDTLASELSLLAYDFSAPPEWNVKAIPDRFVEMKRCDPKTLDRRGIMRTFPPLVRGYLGLGCFIGEGAVIDKAFNTTDVLIIMPVSEVTPRYASYLDRATMETSSSTPFSAEKAL